MTKEEFSKSYWTVQFYGALYGLLKLYAVLFGFTAAAVMWAPALGELVRNYVKDEGIVGSIGGLIMGIGLIPFVLLAFLPVRWIDGRFGVRCPGCKRSLTLGGETAKVLRTGRCCHCQELLFNDTESG